MCIMTCHCNDKSDNLIIITVNVYCQRLVSMFIKIYVEFIFSQENIIAD